MIFKNAINSQSVTYTTIENVENYFREQNQDGVKATLTNAEKLSPVAAAHRIFTNSLAAMPFSVRRKVGEERYEPNHPLDSVLKLRANPAMSPFVAQKVIFSNAFWHGVGFAIIDIGTDGQVKNIIPVPTEGHARYVDKDTGKAWYLFEVPDGTPNGGKLRRKFPAEQLLIHYFETYDGLHGRGFLQLAKSAVEADLAAQKYNKKFFTQGARVSGLLQTDDELSPGSVDLVKENFEKAAYGLDNAFRVAVLDNGLKYTQLGISQKDSQFLETRAFSVDEVARITGIPSYMLQTGKQSYQSNQQQQLDFVTSTLLSPVTQAEQEWTYKLLLPEDRDKGFYLRKNVASLLRGDDESRSRYYEKMIALGIYNQDNCRALEDKSPLPNDEGKHFWMSKNYDTIQNIVKGTEN